MHVVYNGPEDAVVVGDGVVFKHGEPVEVSTELGKSLIEQSTFSAAKKAAKDDD